MYHSHITHIGNDLQFPRHTTLRQSAAPLSQAIGPLSRGLSFLVYYTGMAMERQPFTPVSNRVDFILLKEYNFFEEVAV